MCFDENSIEFSIITGAGLYQYRRSEAINAKEVSKIECYEYYTTKLNSYRRSTNHTQFKCRRHLNKR